MIKSSIILFITCFLLYLPFSREPDYFDSELTPATLIGQGDSVCATYLELGRTYKLPVSKQYSNRIGQTIEIRYELRDPQKAVVNQAWGYWFVAKEMLWAFGIFAILLGVAFATTHQPDPTALAEQLAYKKENKGKYQQ
jgi:hypothetical protein